MKTSRREILFMLGAMGCTPGPEPEAAAPPKESHRFRLAVCNETFQDATFEQGCRGAIETGYTGLEIAPFTLSEDPATIPASQRAEYKKIMASEGVEYIGLHSLLTVPRGQLHITTPDDTVRNRSWEYFRKLIDLCADLGDGGLMILGSGKQRRTVEGSTVEDAVKRITEGLASIAPHAQERGVIVMPETLAPHLCDVLTSLDQTMEVVKQINSPAIQTMFDTHNAVAETIPHDELIKKYAPYIKHVHINEMDGRHPGTGSYDFSVPLQALKDIAYTGWLSLEVFKFEPSGDVVARESARLLREIEANLS